MRTADHGYRRPRPDLARHPSETDERMMVPGGAGAPTPTSCRPLCGGDGTLVSVQACPNSMSPDLWLRDYTGQTRLWVKRASPRKAHSQSRGKADQVVVYTFRTPPMCGGRAFRTKLTRPQ